MKIHRRISALLTAVLLLLTVSVPSLAHDVPDLSRTGSIAFKMRCGDSSVPGGILTLRRVGEIGTDDGNYFFVLTDDFAGSELSLEDVSSPELASALAQYARLNGITGEDVAIGSDGTAKAEGLVLGLYLVTQRFPAYGYSSVEPFLVSVPMYENEVYVYDVDAEPKMGPVTELPVVIVSPSPVPSEPVPSGEPVNPSEPPVKPTEPVSPAEPTDPSLPQTGQLNWPVPALTVLGLCLMLLGFYLRSSKEKTV